MNARLKWVVTGALSLVLLAYVGVQAYRTLYRPVQVQRATVATVQDAVSCNALALRSETLLKGASAGVVDYTLADGEHVSKGGVVANIYPTGEDAQNARALSALQNQIASLQNLGTAQSVGASDVGVLGEALNESFLSLEKSISGSDLSGLADASDNVLDYLNRKQLATGAVTDFNAEIAALQTQANTLAPKVNGKATPLASPLAGDFSSTVDGYEGAYDLANIASIRPADVEKLLAEKPAPDTSAVGKVISDYQWYVVAVLSADDAHRLKEGAQVSLRFTQTEEDAVPAAVTALNSTGSKYAAVFSCDNMTQGLAAVRKQQVQVIVASYSGIQVDNRFISVVGGKQGVFVRDGNTARFRTITPVYSGNGYTVSAVDTSDLNRLQVYDAVITNRDDLHDGELLE